MSWQRANILSILLDILIFCIEHHVLEARQFLCRDDLLPRISVLARSRHLFLASTVVRVFRKLLNRSDMMYSRRINEQHSLEPILCTLEDTAETYNILQSSVMELMDQIVQNFMRDIGMNLWQEYSEKLESYHAFRRTELFTRFRDEYSKRKQQQERRNVMTRWNAGGSTQSTFNTSTDTSTADLSDHWFNKSGSQNGDDPYSLQENEDIIANQVFDRDPAGLANSKHKENLSNDNWFSEDGENVSSSAKNERLPELSTLVGSLKNESSNGFESSGGFLIKDSQEAEEDVSSDDDETELVIGPMPPKRKVDSDEENDDILGSTNFGTVGKLEVNKTGIATKLKIKPINITVKTKAFEKNEDEKENLSVGIDNSEFESDKSLEMDKSVEITEINEKSDTDGLDRIRETKKAENGDPKNEKNQKNDENDSNEPKNAETPKIIGASSSSNSDTNNFRSVLAETSSDSNGATEGKIKENGDSEKPNPEQSGTNTLTSPATSTTSSSSSLLPRKRKSGELLPSANSTSENGSTSSVIESIQEETSDDIESTCSKVRKTEFDVNAAKLASEKNNHKIKDNSSNTLSDTKLNGN